MAPLQNSSNSSKNSSQTPQLQNSLELPTLWSCSANGGGVLEHLFCNSNSTQSCSIRQFQLNSKLAPPGVLEWSSSTQSWSHAKQGLRVGVLGGASSRWSRSCKRGAPKLHLHLHYSSMELAAPWSFGVGVFGWKIGWSCWSSAPEPCQTPPIS